MPTQDTHSYSNPDNGSIDHIDLDLTIDFDQQIISGTAVYTLDRTVSGSFFLDASGQTIRSASIYDQPIRSQIDRDDPVLGQRLTLEFPQPTDEFSITFQTSPHASALQWLPPEQTAGGEHPFLYTQCQAIQARSIFPCQDAPAIRFTYSASVTIKQGSSVVMAAALVGRSATTNQDTFHFEMPQRIPSYLFALAAGNISSRELGPRCRIYAEPEVLEAAAWEFAETEESLMVAEELLGPYEWDRYDLLIMPPSFPYGGMENPRLNFITPTILVKDRSLVDLINHEMAHAWTGNLVTNATWADFWLNEGWTTYAERRISERLAGVDYVRLKAAIEREDMLELIGRIGETSNLTRLKFDQTGLDPNLCLTVIAYTKGCEFLKLLEDAVGRQIFDSFVKEYLNTYKFRSITTEEFISFLKQELPEAARAVDINEWLYGTGFPDTAPPIESNLLDETEEAIRGYQNGYLPAPEQTAHWNPHQIQYFLIRMPKEIPTEDVIGLDELFNILGTQKTVLLSPYLDIAVRSGYKEILPDVEDFVGHVGRIFYIARVYRALVSTDWSRILARPLFEHYRYRHHPITVAYIEEILKKGGL